MYSSYGLALNMLDIESMDVAQVPLVCMCVRAIFIHSTYYSYIFERFFHTIQKMSLIGIYGMSLCSMKSVIDRYGRAKDEEQLVANPNTELKVCHYK